MVNSIDTMVLKRVGAVERWRHGYSYQRAHKIEYSKVVIL